MYVSRMLLLYKSYNYENKEKHLKIKSRFEGRGGRGGFRHTLYVAYFLLAMHAGLKLNFFLIFLLTGATKNKIKK